MKRFEMDYKRLILLLLPTFLRKELLFAFLQAMTAPVTSLYNRFMTNRHANLYRLQRNGQVCYLRRMLNEAFPDADGTIRIEDASSVAKWQYVWDTNYNPQDYYLLISESGTLFWNVAFFLEAASKFVVVLPVAFATNQNGLDKVKSLLNEYKLLSKSYIITYE